MLSCNPLHLMYLLAAKDRLDSASNDSDQLFCRCSASTTSGVCWFCQATLSQCCINLLPSLFWQFYCLKNIRNFLASCSRDFGLTQEALFDANELFDVSDFAKVSTSLCLEFYNVDFIFAPNFPLTFRGNYFKNHRWSLCYNYFRALNNDTNSEGTL